MEIVIYILALSWLSNLIAWRLEFDWWIKIKTKYLTHKIFNCSTCTGFWLGLITSLILLPFNNLSIFCISLVISLISSIIEKILFKF